ncbi:hypothetical protein ACU635_36210 [[Actinomadura] parvosata]|uniref:hypothetical protein n=1 Tax=[Actinomadura] parvosata TaxID=1955412 RepID=UPI00406C22E6
MIAIIGSCVAALAAAGTFITAPATPADHACGRSPDGAAVVAEMAGDRARACEIAMDVAVAYQNGFPSSREALPDDLVSFTVQVDGAPWECMTVQRAQDTKPHGQCVHPSGDNVKLYG